MKKFFLYAILISLGITGCELQNIDYSNISDEVFPNNENDADALVNACYVDIGYFWASDPWNGFPIITEMTTDIMQCNWGDGGVWSNISELKYTPTNGKVLVPYDQHKRISIYTMNIDRIENLPMGNIELKERYIAEIKAIRAWLSYLLYVHYGTFPVATLDILKNPQQEVILPREEPGVLEAMIEKDLKEAIDVLPESYGESDFGRLTKGAARMILMKFYMHTKRWSEAEYVGRKIMAMGYGLMDNYEDIFQIQYAGNKECIYTIPHSANNPNQFLTCTYPYNYPSLNPNISKWSGLRSRWEFYDTFDKKDKRLKLLIGEYVGTDGEIYNRENPGGAGEIGLGPIPIKSGEDPDDAGTTSSAPQVVYRYADVLLLLAEAINRQIGPTKEAVNLVNQVRSRAGVEPFTLEEMTSAEIFNDKILEERGRELFCEGQRREDLIRHGKFIEFAKKRPNTLAEPHKILFPINQSYINEGKGIVLQNPGY